MNITHLDTHKHYFLACSFGPDSMALFHLLQKANLSFSVLHVNYHRRGEVSNEEERQLKEYCMNNNVVCYVYDTSGIEVKGNFQAWARKLRYRYFKTMLDAHPHVSAVLVAHHQDDVIETYLMQKQSQRLSLYYGIEEDTIIEGVRVLRPLLEYKKSDLLHIVEKHNIPFSIDASNLKDDYTRNKIRHAIVERLSPSERMALLSKMNDRNAHNHQLIETFSAGLTGKNRAKTSDFIFLTPEDFAFVMTYFLRTNGMTNAISLPKFTEMKRMLERVNVPNVVLFESESLQLIRAYDEVRVVPASIANDYSYVLDKPGVFENDFIYFDGQNPRNLKRVPLEAYPITLRPAFANDVVKVAKYLKKVNRLYIDWKMPQRLRKLWPVFVNKEGTVIYVPRYQQNYVHKGDNSLLLRL